MYFVTDISLCNFQPMAAGIFVAICFVFLFVQHATSQQACTDAITALGSSTNQCAANSMAICTGNCRDLYDNVIKECEDFNQVRRLGCAIDYIYGYARDDVCVFS